MTSCADHWPEITRELDASDWLLKQAPGMPGAIGPTSLLAGFFSYKEVPYFILDDAVEKRFQDDWRDFASEGSMSPNNQLDMSHHRQDMKTLAVAGCSGACALLRHSRPASGA